MNSGWKIYSVERFYDGPVVYDASIDGETLSFTAHAPFKLSRTVSATWALSSGASGSFSFPAYWRAKTVTAAVTGGGTLTVTDEWGRSSYVDV